MWWEQTIWFYLNHHYFKRSTYFTLQVVVTNTNLERLVVRSTVCWPRYFNASVGKYTAYSGKETNFHKIHHTVNFNFLSSCNNSTLLECLFHVLLLSFIGEVVPFFPLELSVNVFWKCKALLKQCLLNTMVFFLNKKEAATLLLFLTHG